VATKEPKGDTAIESHRQRAIHNEGGDRTGEEKKWRRRRKEARPHPPHLVSHWLFTAATLKACSLTAPCTTPCT
jgi:hypothetical protein